MREERAVVVAGAMGEEGEATEKYVVPSVENFSELYILFVYYKALYFLHYSKVCRLPAYIALEET